MVSCLAYFQYSDNANYMLNKITITNHKGENKKITIQNKRKEKIGGKR